LLDFEVVLRRKRMYHWFGKYRIQNKGGIKIDVSAFTGAA
jgi:hypothetical protein